MSRGIDLAELDRVAAQVAEAGNAAAFCANAIVAARRMNQPELLDRALTDARRAMETADTALVRLRALGASTGPTVARDTLPLELLDTEASRRYLAALEAAAEAGAILDRERGWVDANGNQPDTAKRWQGWRSPCAGRYSGRRGESNY